MAFKGPIRPRDCHATSGEGERREERFKKGLEGRLPGEEFLKLIGDRLWYTEGSRRKVDDLTNITSTLAELWYRELSNTIQYMYLSQDLISRNTFSESVAHCLQS